MILRERPSLIKFTVFVLLRFSRENKHFPTRSALAGDVEAWGPAGTGPSCGAPAVGVYPAASVQLREPPLLRPASPPDKVRFDKPQIIH